MMHMFGYGWTGMLVCILFWALLLVGLTYLIKNIFTKDDSNSAFKILDEKLANGDITEEEYNHKRDILKNAQKS